MYGLLLGEEIAFDAEEAMRRLRILGVDTRPFFWPMHEQPVFLKQGLFAGESYPAAEELARRGFYLPSGLGSLRANQAGRHYSEERFRVSQFAEYAPYYDRLYRDKDYAAEAAYVLGLVRRKLSPGAIVSGTRVRNGSTRATVLRCRCTSSWCGSQFRDAGVGPGATANTDPGNCCANGFYRREMCGRYECSETFDAVISLFHVVSYQSSNQDLQDCFATAKHHLRRGGVFVFDCWYGPAVLNDLPR